MEEFIYETIKRLALQNGLWFCHPTGSDHEPTEFLGWFIPPSLMNCRFAVTVDGELIEKRPSKVATDGMEYVFERLNLLSEIQDLTFLFSTNSRKEFPDYSTIEIHSELRNKLLPFYFATFGGLDTPEPENIKRTSGHGDKNIFNYMGLTDAVRLKKIFERYRSRTDETPTVLDWGCGCGRVSRFFEKFFDPSCVFGVDIDPINIAWNQRHIDRNRYKLISQKPKLPYDNETFDLICGISVMTHLRHADQKAWLAELYRATKKGGIVILTYHSLPMFFAHVNDGETLERLLKDGFVDCGRNNDLDDQFSDAKDADGYRNVFNTLPDILKVNEGLFRVMDHLPGGHASQHDYVVLKKL